MLPARILIPLLWALGLLNLANGAWMLLHAWSWFQWIPGVSDTGAANAHFIHDVGVAYAVCGIGLIYCARHPAQGRPVFLGVTLFTSGHALGHVAEILAGLLPAAHWLVDLPLVFAPALLLLWLSRRAQWEALGQTPAAGVSAR